MQLITASNKRKIKKVGFWGQRAERQMATRIKDHHDEKVSTCEHHHMKQLLCLLSEPFWQCI